ncbi:MULTISPECIES: DUF1877 family protein [unclassified Sphingomonas]|uniref:DUF1877 family protein n=1 Tax=unclassified Sphingomonas TaxID=196159 RepID=UPI0008379C03|nr:MULTISPECIES: DUF1877 family protein [unclassified Sphingomonas]
MSMVVYLRRATPEQVSALATGSLQLESVMFDGPKDGLFDCEKAWHALHFMLTGHSGHSDHPLSVLETGDENLIGTDDLGLGGYWLIEPSQVRRFAAELEVLSDAEIAKRYDPVAMATEHVYLSDMFEEEGDAALPYVMQGVPKLRAVSRAAADAGDYLIGILS